MTVTFSELPTEVIYQVLLHLPPSSVPILQQVSTQFNDLSQPLLWRHHCRTLYHHWSPERNIEAKFNEPVAKVDWKQLFAERHMINRSISREIDSILASQVSRIDKTERIVGHGYDAKDTLLRQLSVSDDTEDVLARRFYSDAVLGSVHRTMAITEWMKLKNGEAVPLERALAAFDLFVLHGRKGDFDEISALLDQIAEQVRADDTDFTDRSPRSRAITLAEFLRRRNFTGIQGDAHYHDLQNNFIGIALQDDDHPSLPLISVSIYCCIAKRLGINAQPCGFPFHVLAIVKPPPGLDMDGQNLEPGAETPTPMYMDPFRSSEEMDPTDLKAQLQSLGIPLRHQPELLDASPTDEIVRRSAKNIITSVQTFPRHNGPGPRSATSSFPDHEGAFYAALWALMLLPDGSYYSAGMQRARYLHFILERLEKQTVMDVGLIEKHILPLIEDPTQYGGLLDNIRVMRSGDRMPRQIKARNTRNTQEKVKYRIGQVFHHKRYHYQAVITGWDVECAATPDWMDHMGIHTLSRGQHQSFYHVLVDDRSVRYVAEENIAIVQQEVNPELMALAGQHFKRFDEASSTFVSNIKDEYPDD